MNSQAAILVLEDGRAFRGRAFGAEGESFGELVFTTAMSGYQQLVSDPSCRGQLLGLTAPHVGDSAWDASDDTSGRVQAAGLIVRDAPPRSEGWLNSGSLDAELARQGVVGIAEVDTRALTRHIRSAGGMRAAISTTELDPAVLLERVREQPPTAGLDLVAQVTAEVPYVIPSEGQKKFTVAVLDLGIWSGAPQRLAVLGVEQHVFPSTATWDQIAAVRPDGLFVSNGPGDPAAAGGPQAVLARALEAGVPVLAICLGHQLFGRALGFETYRLKFGHHGLNQPVKELATGRIEITTQHHSFGVDAPVGRDVEVPYGTARVSHVCVNDGVVEGLELRRAGDLVAFSVQYHPDPVAGPNDSTHLIGRFVEILGRKEA